MADTSGIRAGRAYVEIGGDTSKLGKALTASKALLGEFAGQLSAVAQSAALAGAAIVAPFAAAARTFIATGDQLNDMAIRTGATVEALSQLSFAAQLSGTSIEGVETGLRKMQRTIADAAGGSKSAQDALAQLGLTAAELIELQPDQQLSRFADALAGINDPTMRAAAAMQVFGRSGTQLLPLLAGGSAALNEMRMAADKLGVTISAETAAKAAQLDDMLNILKQSTIVLAVEIGASLAPIIKGATAYLIDAAKATAKFVREHSALIRIVAVSGAVLFGTGVVIKSLSLAFGIAATVSGVLTTAINILSKATAVGISLTSVYNAVLAAGPNVLLGAALAAGALAAAVWLISKAMDSASAEFDEFLEKAEKAKKIGGLAVDVEDEGRGRVEEKNLASREEELAQKLAQLRINGIEDEGARRIAEINAASAKEMEAVRDVHAQRMALAESRSKDELAGIEAERSKRLAAASELGLAARKAHEASLADPQNVTKQSEFVFARDKANKAFSEGEETTREFQKKISAEQRFEKNKQQLAEQAAAETGEFQKALDRDRAKINDEIEKRRAAAIDENINRRLSADAEVGQAEIDLIEDVHDRRRAQIIEEGKLRIEQAVLAGNAEDAQAADKIMALQLERNERDRTAALTEKASRISAANADQKMRVEELTLRTKFKGAELELKLLDLQRQQAIERARAAGEDVALVEREFDLRKQLATAGGALGTKLQSQTFQNPFAALAGIGRGSEMKALEKLSERTAKAAEETARNTRKPLQFG